MAIMKTLPPFTVLPVGPVARPATALPTADTLTISARALPAECSREVREWFLSGVLFPSASSLLAARDQDLCRELSTAAETAEGPVHRQLCEKAFDLLRMGDDDQRVQALERLVELRAPTIAPFLLDELERPTLGLNREWLFQAIGNLGESLAVLPLIDLIEDRLEHCVELVGLSSHALRQELHDASWLNSDASCAAKSLAVIGDPRAVEPIMTLFDLEPCARDRAELACALGALGDLSVLDRLIPELREKIEQPVAMGILKALGQLRDERSFEELMASLESPANRIVETALLALGTFGDVRAVPRMLPFAEHRDHHVRAAALEALGMIGHPRGVGLLLCAVSLRGNVIAPAVLRGLGWSHAPRAFPHLVDALESQSLYRRRAAIEALKVCKDPRAVQALIDHLCKTSHRTGTNNVWYRALVALGEIGDERALGFLSRIAKQDPDEIVRDDAALFGERIQRRMAAQKKL